MTLSEEVLAPTRPERRSSVLETERLVLRAPRMSDAAAIALAANDRRIAENTARVPHPYGIAEAEQFVATIDAQAGDTTFVIVLGDEVIGACGLDADKKPLELGYWLGAAYWGRGYATEAARAVIDYAFTELGCESLQSGARVTNPASRRVLEKCGFQWLGVRLTRISAINSSAPVDRLCLDRKLWASLKSWGSVKRVA